MAIDWANEPYVRLFKRETDDDLLLSWEARAVWHEMLKRFDRSGLLETRRGVRGLAALIRFPLEVVERVMPELAEDGRVVSVPDRGFCSPNYIAANDTPRSNRARQEESRIRRSQEALNNENRTSAPGNGASRDVTPRNAESRHVTQSRAEQSQSSQQSPEAPPSEGLSDLKAKCDAMEGPAETGKRRHAIPDDWTPRQEERDLAVRLGLDCDHEAAEFASYWQGDGRPKKDWDKTFRNRLMTQSKRRQPYGGAQSQIRIIPDM